MRAAVAAGPTREGRSAPAVADRFLRSAAQRDDPERGRLRPVPAEPHAVTARDTVGFRNAREDRAGDGAPLRPGTLQGAGEAMPTPRTGRARAAYGER
ncbi:hypothetical protein [Streptomyces sp. enrichment culture]|uniref:hypothetical protein n=1 Tax=Streptomyces sp. enrichment culture TaxID=1795815 RepID=UPI003F57D65D